MQQEFERRGSVNVYNSSVPSKVEQGIDRRQLLMRALCQI